MFEGAFSPFHWLVVLLIVLVIFGPKKLPELGKGLGTAIRGFKEGLKGMSEGVQAPDKDSKTEAKASPAKPELKG
jgi:sec-independent protein translocase protein TatA